MHIAVSEHIYWSLALNGQSCNLYSYYDADVDAKTINYSL